MDFFFPICNLKKAEDIWAGNEVHDILSLHAADNIQEEGGRATET